jgi:hypothetical protein
MRCCLLALSCGLMPLLALPSAPDSLSRPAWNFRVQEIDRTLKVGYAVLLADISGDGKKDIVVADTTRVVWFENPSWKMRIITQGKTAVDNVCLDAHDIDGDGQLDLALGAGWQGLNAQAQGTLQWLKRGKTLDDEWKIHPIVREPSIHRIRFADLDGDGKPELISAPLLGPNSTAGKNWSEMPIRLRAYRIPANPKEDEWSAETIDESLHVCHNFQAIDVDGDGRLDLITASYEGVTLFQRSADGKWSKRLIGMGNQDQPTKRRGTSEIKLGRLSSQSRFIATIEPWHGFQVVVYLPPKSGETLWQRRVIDDRLQWGHAVWCADLDGDGAEEIIVGVRDTFTPQEPRGVRVYRAASADGMKWERFLLDPDGVAVEDMAVADLDGDGKPDIVAVGRATGNVRIYWNEGRKP